jgi:dTDP-4-dehydrorhamnose reductase
MGLRELPMKVLVIGSGGMLGHMLTLYLKANKEFSVTNITKRNCWLSDTILLDVSNYDTFHSFLKNENFDAIINCAALLVSASEKNKSKSILLNAALPHILEEWTSGSNTRVIQISSDGVFNGNKAPYQIDDNPDGRIFYARTKILGELHNSKDLTIRGSFIGPELKESGTGLFHWFLHQEGNVKGYKNVIFNGITSLQCAKAIEHILLHSVTGCIHLGALQPVSKGRLLTLIAECWGIDKVKIEQTAFLQSDHTLAQLYNPEGYDLPDYPIMLEDMKKWMEKNSQYYANYDLGNRR